MQKRGAAPIRTGSGGPQVNEDARVYAAGEWAWLSDSGQACQIVDRQGLWGASSYRVWLPSQGAVVRVPGERLAPLGTQDKSAVGYQLVYAAAAARIADALERDTLVAPLEGTLLPLPHQIDALSRAMSGDRVRYLLADEVGLGKTIEAGLILRELKIRGLVKRALVVAPTGLVTQWVQEMRTHFNEEFHLVIPGGFAAARQLAGFDEAENLWRLHDQVVCPVDSVKPMENRRGWSHEQLARYNRERFQDLVSAGWDLVVIDEAHRLGGSSEQVARYQLGEALAQAAPYLLLLSATPHQGKTDAFRRLLAFLDPESFPDDESVSHERVAPYVVRTEKRRAIDEDGNPLFKPRHTQLVPVEWGAEHEEQRALYEAVTEYVREGYNQALREKRTAVGFLMILMQRLVTSSTRAIRTSLERRLEVLELPDGQLSLFGEDIGDDWATLDGQEQMETVLKERLRGLKNERAEVELLLSAARRCEAQGPDVKAQALLDWVQKLQRDEKDPDLKVLVFTEFVPTQEMLAYFLSDRGFTVTCLNGTMGMEERRGVQKAFAREAHVLISTDAGGEGLNLQFCHVVVNYDLPWNPMKLEQRIGRVDRIGQTHVVRALNIALEGTVELRVREVIEEKLARILEEFGVDKLADVLDSEEGEVDFETLYASAMLRPEDVEARVEKLAEDLRQRAQAAREGSSVLGPSRELDPTAAQKIAAHQIPFWTERATLSWLRSQEERGAEVAADEVGYRLLWPDSHEIRRAVFTRAEAEQPGTEHLSLEAPRIRSLTAQLPFFAPGQPVASIEIAGVSDKVAGMWSLWRVALQTEEGREQRVLPLFVSDEGRVLAPTARAVWDRLIETDGEAPAIRSVALAGEHAAEAYERSQDAAEDHGRVIYEELLGLHRERLDRERRKGEHAFAARVRAIHRVGLEQVREYRLRQLDEEQHEWEARMSARAAALPELNAILLLRVAAEGELS